MSLAVLFIYMCFQSRYYSALSLSYQTYLSQLDTVLIQVIGWEKCFNRVIDEAMYCHKDEVLKLAMLYFLHFILTIIHGGERAEEA
jgi:hypothetical protein